MALTCRFLNRGGVRLLCGQKKRGSLNMYQVYRSPCDICGGQRGIDTGVSPSTSVFSLSISLHLFCSLNFIYTLILTRRTNRRSLGTYQKAMLFHKSGTTGLKSTFIYSLRGSSCSVRECDMKSTTKMEYLL